MIQQTIADEGRVPRMLFLQLWGGPNITPDEPHLTEGDCQCQTRGKRHITLSLTGDSRKPQPTLLLEFQKSYHLLLGVMLTSSHSHEGKYSEERVFDK